VHAFLFSQAEGLVDLTPTSDTGYALDINDAGQVTGYKTAFGGYHAFRWQEGTFVDLGVLPGFAHSFGWAVGATGQVAGSSATAWGNSERFVRSTDAGGLEKLGGTGEHNVAQGINASGPRGWHARAIGEACRALHRRGGIAGPEHADQPLFGLGPAGRP
jgi:probable HAF family extracellular repeat protein